MKKVISLASNEEWNYSTCVSDLFAVCNTYCLNNNLGSWFLSKVYEKADYTKELPVTVGNQTIACGDYCIAKSGVTPEFSLY